MARINTTELVHHATNVGGRVQQVVQDPAVKTSWSQAGGDLAQAATSVKAAFAETQAAWRRTDRPAVAAVA